MSTPTETFIIPDNLRILMDGTATTTTTSLEQQLRDQQLQTEQSIWKTFQAQQTGIDGHYRVLVGHQDILRGHQDLITGHQDAIEQLFKQQIDQYTELAKRSRVANYEITVMSFLMVILFILNIGRRHRINDKDETPNI